MCINIAVWYHTIHLFFQSTDFPQGELLITVCMIISQDLTISLSVHMCICTYWQKIQSNYLYIRSFKRNINNKNKLCDDRVIHILEFISGTDMWRVSNCCFRTVCKIPKNWGFQCTIYRLRDFVLSYEIFITFYFLLNTGDGAFQYKGILYRYMNPVRKIGRSWDHFVFIIGIPILVRRYLCIETAFDVFVFIQPSMQRQTQDKNII